MGIVDQFNAVEAVFWIVLGALTALFAGGGAFDWPDADPADLADLHLDCIWYFGSLRTHHRGLVEALMAFGLESRLVAEFCCNCISGAEESEDYAFLTNSDFNDMAPMPSILQSIL